MLQFLTLYSTWWEAIEPAMNNSAFLYSGIKHPEFCGDSRILDTWGFFLPACSYCKQRNMLCCAIPGCLESFWA